MNRKSIFIIILATGIISIVFSVIILNFSDGMRRWYSGSFFALIGIVMLYNAWRWKS